MLVNNPKTAKLVHRAKLKDFLHEYKYIVFVYDYGDDWTHYIEVVGSLDDTHGDLPVLLAGENDSPPEDCGGPLGFVDFLHAISNPTHIEHEDMTEWAAFQCWEPFNFERARLRVYLAGNPGKYVWVKEN